MLLRNRFLTPLRLVAMSGLVLSLVISAWSYQDRSMAVMDTIDLIKDTGRLLDYLDGSRLTRPGGRFPLLQAIPVVIMTRMRLDLNEQLQYLIFLNLLSLLISLAWGMFALRGRFAPLVFVSTLLLSPLPHYSRTSFGEMLAAFCTLGLVISSCADLGRAIIIGTERQELTPSGAF